MYLSFTQSELNAMTDRQLNALLHKALASLADLPPSSEGRQRIQALLPQIRVALSAKQKMRGLNLAF